MITAKIAPWKKDRVQELTDVLNSEGVVGIVDVGGVPAGNIRSCYVKTSMGPAIKVEVIE